MSEIDTAAMERYRADLDEIQAEFVRVIRHHLPRVGAQLISHAVTELAAAVLADIVAAMPASAGEIDHRLDLVKLFVATAHQQPQ